MTTAAHLSLRTKLAFGVGSVAEGAIYIAFNTWNFLFYNHVLGLSGTLCGLAVTLSLLIDAVADPVVGSLSDRLRSRLGRRHPFLYATALPLAVTFYGLYVPPASLSGFSLFLWFTLFATLHRIAMTLYHVPHLALGAELTADYRERSVVMGYNALFQVVGGAGAAFLGWSRFARLPGGTAARDNYVSVAVGVGVVSALAILVSAHFTRDQIPRLARPVYTRPFSTRELFAEIADCLRNHNYRNLLLGFLLLGAMLGMRETLDSYTGLFFWQLPEQKLRLFGLASPPAYLLAFFAVARLHRRFEKRHTIIGSASLAAFAAFTPITLRLMHLFPANGAPSLLKILLFFSFLFYLGIAVLTISVLSALADVADEHELTTGRRQEGIFYAARTLFNKVSSGAGHIIAGLGIDLIQFPQAAKPGTVPDSVLFSLGVLNGPLAVLPAALAVIFYARYHIDRQRHAEIHRTLAERKKTIGADSEQDDGLVAAAEPAAG